MHPNESGVRSLEFGVKAPGSELQTTDYLFPIPPSSQPQFSFRIPGAYKPDAYAVKEQETIIKKQTHTAKLLISSPEKIKLIHYQSF
jgi:hypothetical protein